MACCRLALLFVAVILFTSQTSDGKTVEARDLKLMVNSKTTWTAARRTCEDLSGMALATMDKHITSFLRSQTATARFRQNVKDSFWIGLHDRDLTDKSSSPIGYQWVQQCDTLSGWPNWEHGQPSDTDEAFCVYAKNDTFEWNTDKCDEMHDFICEKRRDNCTYERTDDSCELFSTAKSKTMYTTPADDKHYKCSKHCETTLKDSNPCWGFTTSPTGCTLFYQPDQPSCSEVTTAASQSANNYVFRSCFDLVYIHGPIFRPPSNDTVPLSHCHVQTSPATTRGTTNTTQLKTEVTTSRTTKTTLTTTNTTAKVTTTTSATTTTTKKLTTTQDATTAQTSTENSLTTETVATTEQETSPTATDRTTSPTVTAAKRHLQTARPIIQRPPPRFPKLPRCVCTRDVKPPPNVTSAALKAAEETKQLLAVDKETLSRTRRRRGSAVDNRPSARGMAYFGVAFLVLTMSVIVLPDVTTIVCHLRHGAGYYGYALTPRRKSLNFVKVS